MQNIKKKVPIFKYSLRGAKDILSTYKPATNFFNIKFIFIIQSTFDIANFFATPLNINKYKFMIVIIIIDINSY